MVAASFVTVDRVEIPYYVILLGAGVLKLSYLPGDKPLPSVQNMGWGNKFSNFHTPSSNAPVQA
jgi:hypothetical protein